jgi:hypothetical protein
VVDRGYPLDALKELPRIVEHKENIDPNATINVSPARSACSTTAVYVDTTYTGLYQRLKDDIIEELERTRAVELKELEQRTTEQVTRELEEMKAMELKKMERQVSKQIRKETLPERTAAAYIIKRNVEDFVLQKMATMMGDDAPQIPYHMYIETFLQRFRVFGIEEKDLLLVGRSTNRTVANDYAHLQQTDPLTTQLLDRLFDYILRYGSVAEKERYEKLHKFAIGDFRIERRR